MGDLEENESFALCPWCLRRERSAWQVIHGAPRSRGDGPLAVPPKDTFPGPDARCHTGARSGPGSKGRPARMIIIIMLRMIIIVIHADANRRFRGGVGGVGMEAAASARVWREKLLCRWTQMVLLITTLPL